MINITQLLSTIIVPIVVMIFTARFEMIKIRKQAEEDIKKQKKALIINLQLEEARKLMESLYSIQSNLLMYNVNLCSSELKTKEKEFLDNFELTVSSCLVHAIFFPEIRESIYNTLEKLKQPASANMVKLFTGEKISDEDILVMYKAIYKKEEEIQERIKELSHLIANRIDE